MTVDEVAQKSAQMTAVKNASIAAAVALTLSMYDTHQLKNGRLVKLTEPLIMAFISK